MVLDRSDYNVSNLYKGNWDPSNPKNLVAKAAGTFVAVTFAVYIIQMARGRGVGLLNRLLGNVPGIGGQLQTTGDTTGWP